MCFVHLRCTTLKWFCFVIVLLMASVLAAGELLFDPTTGPVGTLRDDYAGSLGMLFRVDQEVYIFVPHGLCVYAFLCF